MIDWTARARERLVPQRRLATDKTDETRLLAVLAVPHESLAPPREDLSSVLSVGAAQVVVGVAAAEAASSGMAANDPATTPPSSLGQSGGNPYMTAEQGNECHACGWDDLEIERFLDRTAGFTRMGRPDAEHLAERLTLRDRQGDGRHLCLECHELEATGRCAAAHRGAIPGADRRLEPVQYVLLHCPAFKGAESVRRCEKGS